MDGGCGSGFTEIIIFEFAKCWRNLGLICIFVLFYFFLIQT